jgi:poly(A) polymerase
LYYRYGQGETNKQETNSLSKKPHILPRDQHPISRKHIGISALKVLNRLKEGGYDSLLVGGCVRDLMLGITPKDFDVTTNASPEQVRSLFRNARLIGRRFRLAHIRFGREVIEVATYRKPPDDDVETSDSGRLLRDNVFGTQQQDAMRRDFTVNALYYDIRDFSVIDYAGGVKDLERRVIRVIGKAEQRYREDPVRMLRAVRFASKLDFSIAPGTAKPIYLLGGLLNDIPPARMFEEVLKLFHSGYAERTLEMLREYGLFAQLFPQVERYLGSMDNMEHSVLPHALRSTDARIREDKPVTPAFLFAAMLWDELQKHITRLMHNGLPHQQALYLASAEVISEQCRRMVIPRRFSTPMKDIWAMQARFERRRGKQALRLLQHRRFRAAYDFLLLRVLAGEAEQSLADWWTEFQEVSKSKQEAMISALSNRAKGKRGKGRSNKNQ